MNTICRQDFVAAILIMAAEDTAGRSTAMLRKMRITPEQNIIKKAA